MAAKAFLCGKIPCVMARSVCNDLLGNGLARGNAYYSDQSDLSSCVELRSCVEAVVVVKVGLRLKLTSLNVPYGYERH